MVSDLRGVVLVLWDLNSISTPGEQVHILACLSSSKQETQIITPFKVAAMMSKNGIGQSTKKQSGETEDETNSMLGKVEANPDGEDTYHNGENLLKEKIDSEKDISASESLLRMEDHKRQTEILLQKFKNSHFLFGLPSQASPSGQKEVLQKHLYNFLKCLLLSLLRLKLERLLKKLLLLLLLLIKGILMPMSLVV